VWGRCSLVSSALLRPLRCRASPIRQGPAQCRSTVHFSGGHRRLGEIEATGEAHIKARSQLEHTLSDKPTADGVFGERYPNLIKWEKRETTSKVSIYMKDTETVLVGNEKLGSEVERFSAWIKERGGVPPQGWVPPPD